MKASLCQMVFKGPFLRIRTGSEALAIRSSRSYVSVPRESLRRVGSFLSPPTSEPTLYSPGLAGIDQQRTINTSIRTAAVDSDCFIGPWLIGTDNPSGDGSIQFAFLPISSHRESHHLKHAFTSIWATGVIRARSLQIYDLVTRLPSL